MLLTPSTRSSDKLTETGVIPFDFAPTTRVVFGPGTIEQLGVTTAELGMRQVLVVTDSGIVAAGHVERALQALRGAGVTASVFDGVAENPTTAHVDACVARCREVGAEGLIGLGGGSAMDTAKGANFLVTNGGRMEDYWGVGKATQPMLPFIAVPTTAGTGSEAQSFALIAQEESHQKMACGDKKAAARVAILDPELTISQPPKVSATSGIDALAHAIESFVTTKRTAISSMLAREAWRHLSIGLPVVLEQPENIDARAHMLLGAHLAGCAIEQSMLGATHSAANPLTAHYGVTHGIAIGIMLPHVIRYNGQQCDALYAELEESPEDGAADRLADQVSALVHAAGLPTDLAACDVPATDFPRLADEARKQWTAQFNPRPIGAPEFEQLYASAYNGRR